jgi:hypothetical protein
VLREVQRAADEPSFEWSRDLLVGAPRPDQEIPAGGCPLPAAQQRDLGVDEASKVCDLYAELPAADSVQGRARPTWIDGRRSAVRAVSPGFASPSISTLTGGPADHGPSPRSPSQAVLTNRRPKRRHCPQVLQRSSLNPALPGAAYSSYTGWTLLRKPPPHAAIGRRERALSFALMPGCPTRGRRSQTSTRPTLLRSQPNTRGPGGRARVRSERVGVEPRALFQAPGEPGC